MHRIYENRFKRILTKLSIAIRNPAYFFLLFAISTGLVFIIITPPLQVSDEQSHFRQAYAVSNLNIIPEKFTSKGTVAYGQEIPTSLSEFIDNFRLPIAGNPDNKVNKSLTLKYVRQPLNKDVTSFQSGTTYSPVVYIPQVIGITIGKIFNTSPLIMLWLGRLMNLVFWTAIIFISIRIIPFGKWAMAILALNPMAVFLSASLSADVMTTALAFLFFSLVASTYVDKENLHRKKIIIIGVVLLLLSLTKQINIIFSLLLLTVPYRKISHDKKKYFYTILLLILFAMIATVAWGMAVGAVNEATSQLQRPGFGVDSSAQLSFVLKNPITYVKIFFENYVLVNPGYFGDAVFVSAIGVFGWLDTNIPLWTIMLYIIGLLLVLMYQLGRGYQTLLWQKLITISTLFLLVLANITALYLYYSPVADKVVSGVQGRYFIPALVLVVGLFSSKKKVLDLNDKQIGYILLGIMTIVYTVVFARIIIRYYIFF